jgi:hypothetical protein
MGKWATFLYSTYWAGKKTKTKTCLPGIRYSRMCDASEITEGTLDALLQLLCPPEAPCHSRHVFVHCGEPWGHRQPDWSKDTAPSSLRSISTSFTYSRIVASTSRLKSPQCRVPVRLGVLLKRKGYLARNSIGEHGFPAQPFWFSWCGHQVIGSFRGSLGDSTCTVWLRDTALN